MLNPTIEAGAVGATAEAPIRIALRLFDTLERNRFLSLFKIIQLQTAIGFSVVDCDHANVVIIDPDEPGGERILRASQGSEGITAIAYTDVSSDLYGHTIEKPVKMKPLMTVLKALAEALRDGAGTVSPKTEKLAAVAEGQFDPDAGIIGMLRSRKHQGGHCLTLPEVGEIYLDYDAQCYYSELGSPRQIAKRFSLLGKEDLEQRACSAEELQSQVSSKQLTQHEIAGLIWALTLFCSNGVPLRDLNVNKPVQLRQWPNLTKLAHQPEHARLCALLVQHPSTIDSAQQRTGIDRQSIISFFNACALLDLLKPVEDSGEEVKQGRVDTGKGALLKKIVNRLFG